MRTLSIPLIITFSLMNLKLISAQGSSGMNSFHKNAFRAEKLQLPESKNSMWDLKFVFRASLDKSDQSNAGATYIPYLKEVWTSHYNNNKLYRWTTKGDTTHMFDSVYTFTIEGVTNVRGLTCDEYSVYAANNSDTIFVINPEGRYLESIIIAPQTVRYITYDPTADQGFGGFWIGNFQTNPQLIDYNGNVIRTLLYSNLGTTNIYGAACDNLSPNGPFLWVFGQTTAAYHSPQEISQVSLLSGNATGVKINANLNLLNYTDSTLAGGLFLADGLYPGKLILGGMMQGTTDILFGYEIASTSFTVSKVFSFGDPTISSSYRIISIPGDINLPVSQFVSTAGNQRKDWNVFYDNGQADNYMVEYNSTSPTFTFKPGNAFWVLSRNQLNISKQVNNVTPDARNMYEIPLHSGWNLISDPFNKPVSWSAIQTENALGTNELIYQWNGSWANPQSLNPYEGYYYNNIKNLTSLFIPAASFLGKSAAVSDYGLKSFLKITTCLKDSEYASAYAAQNSNSKDDFDTYDYFSPPSDFSLLNIYLYNKNLGTQYKNLFIDSRPEIYGGEQFSLRLKNTTGQKVRLKVSGQENYRDYEIFLVNEQTKKFYDLKERSTIELDAFNGTENYKLLIGNSDYVEKEKDIIQSLAYILNQNYPNPFNPSTVISYELPQKSFVKLEVYDALGRIVESLVNAEQPSGIYEVKFEGKALSSGIYFYKLTAGSFIKIRKMLLIK